jgi:hypothetical protein
MSASACHASASPGSKAHGLFKLIEPFPSLSDAQRHSPIHSGYAPRGNARARSISKGKASGTCPRRRKAEARIRRGADHPAVVGPGRAACAAERGSVASAAAALAKGSVMGICIRSSLSAGKKKRGLGAPLAIDGKAAVEALHRPSHQKLNVARA